MKGTMISAIITTYHRDCKYIKRAIESILAQTVSIDDIIIIDDNENNSIFTVALKQLVQEYPQIRYIKQNGNKGAQQARNLGIQNAVGNYIAFLDDDDEWLPKKTELELRIFNCEKDNTALVFCNGYKVDESIGVREPYFPETILEPSFNDMLIRDRIGSTSNPLIRKSALVDIGGFDERLLARQDYDCWLRISNKYKIRGVNLPLFVHYMHDGEQISKNYKKAYIGYLLIYRKNRRAIIKNKEALINMRRNILTNGLLSNNILALRFMIFSKTDLVFLIKLLGKKILPNNFIKFYKRVRKK